MATYKVIQDIEAEDKLLGPFGLRQFIYLVICVGLLFMCYLLISRAGSVGLLFTPLFLAPAAFLGFLAFPFSKDQPTELWMLARINFLFRPRKRIWNQSGVRELVSITAPKHEERQYTNNLTQHEVHSRLQALAETLDSRGWAAKNAGQAYVTPLGTNPDRLVDAGALPQEVAAETYTDNFDPAAGSNPVAAHFDDMLQAKAQQHRQQLMQQMQTPAPEPTGQMPAPAAATSATPPQDFWFMQQPAPSTDAPADNVVFNSQVVNPGSDDSGDDTQVANEGELLDELKAHDAAKPQISSHLPTIQPLDVQRREAEQRQQELARSQALAAEQDTVAAARAAAAAAYAEPAPAEVQSPPPLAAAPSAPSNQPKPVTPADNTAILDFVNNDDLDIATISRQVNKPHQNADGSVEISLH